MSMCRMPGGGGAKNGSGMSGSGLVAPAAPLDPPDDAVLSGALSGIPVMLNCWRVFFVTDHRS